MERVHRADQTSPEKVGGVAIAIFPKGLHVGILHFEFDYSLRVLHLCSHKELQSQPAADVDCKLWVVPDLEPEQIAAISAFCRLVRARHAEKGVPYGFSPPESFFDVTANYVQTDGEGLTCATLVLAVFHRSGVTLIHYHTWPARPEDAAWQQKVVDFFRNSKMTNAEVDAMANTIGRRRFRTLEVAGAACADEYPVDFQIAAAFSDQLVLELSS
jgi:hypothetical protein